VSDVDTHVLRLAIDWHAELAAAHPKQWPKKRESLARTRGLSPEIRALLSSPVSYATLRAEYDKRKEG